MVHGARCMHILFLLFFLSLLGIHPFVLYSNLKDKSAHLLI